MALAADFGNIDHRSRLGRMLAPRSVAFVGGRIAEMAIARCVVAGFEGAIYAVNPMRATMAGHRCYASIEELPVAPDAAYIGVNRDASIEIVRSLAKRGAGGCVCYGAGFAEIGGKGAELQRRLVEAAGDMPLVGPNCFGFISYVDQCALWPYLFGGTHVTQGVALISQSGNVAMDLTMNERSVRFTHVICAGNQAVLGPGDYIDALLEDRRVRAIGLLLEGLDNVSAFEAAVRRALERAVPIVVMKVGRTAAGALRASSHTSSLTGSDTLYDAYFKRLGITRVYSLPQLLEVLKVFDIAGPVPGPDIVSLSCSGGEAAIMADLTEKYGLQTSPFTAAQTQALNAMFPHYVTVSNPFDYNTSIWGDRPGMQACFTASLAGAHHAAVLVYDHPNVAGDEVAEWFAALDAFVAAQEATGMRAFVASTVPELLPREVRERLIASGVTPLQGLDEALFALAAAANYLPRRERAMKQPPPRPAGVRAVAGTPSPLLDEWHSKRHLAAFGLRLPAGRLTNESGLREAANELGFPLVLKACGPAFTHKSELGAVRLGIASGEELQVAAASIRLSCVAHGVRVESYLIERMISDGVAELVVGIHVDAQFGPTLVIGSGGILVELVGDSVSLLLPTDRTSVEEALMSLKVSTLLRGFRGRPPGDIDAATDAILSIAAFAEAHWDTLHELDVNPLIVLPQGRGVAAVDALLRISETN